jgi:hypothetical protein
MIFFIEGFFGCPPPAPPLPRPVREGITTPLLRATPPPEGNYWTVGDRGRSPLQGRGNRDNLSAVYIYRSPSFVFRPGEIQRGARRSVAPLARSPCAHARLIKHPRAGARCRGKSKSLSLGGSFPERAIARAAASRLRRADVAALRRSPCPQARLIIHNGQSPFAAPRRAGEKSAINQCATCADV